MRGHVSPRMTANFQCVECLTAQTKAWKADNTELLSRSRKTYYANNLDRERFQARLWYKDHAEEARASSRRWKRNNRDRALFYSRIRRRDCGDQLRARDRAYRKANSERVREWNGRRRARELLAIGTFSAVDISDRIKWQKGRCACCRALLRRTGYHVDHIYPISRGGSNAPSNLQLLCPRCNRSKGAKDPLEFAQLQGMLL